MKGKCSDPAGARDKLSDAQKDQIAKLLSDGLSRTVIAQRFGVSLDAITRVARIVQARSQ